MRNGVGTAGSEKVLGKSIADARRKAGLTQQELCFKAGLSYSTLAKIERGAIKTPSVFTVAAIAGVTGTSVEQLTGIETTQGSKMPQRAYKTSKSGIKFIYFDVNGVLVHYYQRAFTAIAKDNDVEPEGVESVFWHFNDAVCRGAMSIQDFNSLLAERARAKSISWADYYINNIDPAVGSQDILKWAAQYYRIGLLTNTMPGLTKALIQKGTLPDMQYDAIIDSSEVESIKPEAKIYDKAEKASGVKPDEILLVDDSRTNLMAAKQLGWHVLWFDDYHPEDSEARIKQMLEF